MGSIKSYIRLDCNEWLNTDEKEFKQRIFQYIHLKFPSPSCTFNFISKIMIMTFPEFGSNPPRPGFELGIEVRLLP
jgi:hypothetical protein